MVEVWIPLALGATLAWGLGQIVAKRGATRIGPRRMVAIIGVVEAALFVGVYAAFGFPPIQDAVGAAVGLAAGLVGMLGYVLYFEAIARGTITRIGTITAAYPAITVVLALSFLGEEMTPVQALGVALLVGSALVLGYRETQAGGKTARVVALLVILAFLFWGFWGFLVKIAVTRLGEGAVFPFFAFSNALIGSLLLLQRRIVHGSIGPLGSNWIWPALGTIFGAAGVVLFTLALAGGDAVLVTPLTGAYPVVTVLGAALLLRERVGLVEVAGVGAFLLGLFAVAGG